MQPGGLFSLFSCPLQTYLVLVTLTALCVSNIITVIRMLLLLSYDVLFFLFFFFNLGDIYEQELK